MNKFLGNKVAILVFILPTLLIYSVIVFWPILQVFFRSLYDWNGLTEGTFIGLDNYTRMFEDRLFMTSLYNGLIAAAMLAIFQIGIGTIMALAVADAAVKGRKFLRVSYFIPVVLSITVVCQLWMAMYNADYGLINQVLSKLGISYQQNWLSDGSTAIYAVVFANAWQYMGYHFALLLAAAKSIPEHFMEAAKIDGASRFTAHRKITIPLLAETYKFCLVLAITGGLNSFANMYIMTSGGPGTETYTLTYMMYRSAFRIGEYGYGSANAAFLVIECLLATLIINRLVARERIVY